MGQKDPRVDAYIAKAAPFAQPILEELRRRLHAALPTVGETIKWGMPFFMDDERLLANMAAFKQHCAFGFWRGREVAGTGREGEAMGQFGRITAVADLPPAAEFKALVKAAVAKVRAEADQPKPARAPAPPRMPAEPSRPFTAALDADPAARRFFDSLPPSHRREYVDWINEAKRDTTRDSRIAQAVAWLAEGKRRNWKYEAC